MSHLIRTVSESGEENIEVRPDPPAVTLALTGLPDTCPHCDHQPPDGTRPLHIYNLELSIACPHCWIVIAPVRAVAATDPECE